MDCGKLRSDSHIVINLESKVALVTIVRVFLVAGHVFQTPEVVNIVLEPGIW